MNTVEIGKHISAGRVKKRRTPTPPPLAEKRTIFDGFLPEIGSFLLKHVETA